MTKLPSTPAEARATPLGSLGIDAAKEALGNIPDANARRSMARAIAKHGRKYTDEARQWCAGFAASGCGQP